MDMLKQQVSQSYGYDAAGKNGCAQVEDFVRRLYDPGLQNHDANIYIYTYVCDGNINIFTYDGI